VGFIRKAPAMHATGSAASRIAPWASADARARLARVEQELPDDPVEALRRAAEAAQAHARRIEEEALLLYRRRQRARGDGGRRPRRMLSGQPSMGYPGDKYQAGLEHLDVVEVAVARVVADVMGARFADVRPTSATLANLAVYTALAEPGDTIAVLPDWAGGHLSHHAVGVPGVRGLRVAELPYDPSVLDVDLDRLPAMLAREAPVLVVVGGSLMLRPHRLEAIAEAVHAHGARLLYDASHVAGLVAEGRFQAPLREGADLLTFSTYKSFGGPAGGVVAGDDEELMARVATAVYPGLTANYDLARLLPLGAAALGTAPAGGSLPDACIANARRLEGRSPGGPRRARRGHGSTLLAPRRGGRARRRRRGRPPPAGWPRSTCCCRRSAARRPTAPTRGEPSGSARKTVTRQGFGEADMPDVGRVLPPGCAVALIPLTCAARWPPIRRRHTGDLDGLRGGSA
jgi:glycine hydroxymethyltransferase